MEPWLEAESRIRRDEALENARAAGRSRLAARAAAQRVRVRSLPARRR